MSRFGYSIVAWIELVVAVDKGDGHIFNRTAAARWFEGAITPMTRIDGGRLPRRLVNVCFA